MNNKLAKFLGRDSRLFSPPSYQKLSTPLYYVRWWNSYKWASADWRSIMKPEWKSGFIMRASFPARTFSITYIICAHTLSLTLSLHLSNYVWLTALMRSDRSKQSDNSCCRLSAVSDSMFLFSLFNYYFCSAKINVFTLLKCRSNHTIVSAVFYQ